VWRVAAQVPDSFEIGSAPPSSKPRPKQTEEPAEPTVKVKGLFEMKLAKEDKKVGTLVAMNMYD
jgi:hypothetical protein